MLQAYSLHSRARVYLFQDDSEKNIHIKRIEVIRPRGNSVVFEFPWNGSVYSETGYPISTGKDAKRTYVLRDNSPTNHTDLSFSLHFDSGIIHNFSGGLSSVSHIDGRSVSVGSMIGTTINLNGNSIITPRYKISLKWAGGKIFQVSYQSKDKKQTAIATLTYSEKKITKIENSLFPKLTFTASDSSVAFSSGISISKSGNEITRNIPGSGEFKVTTVLSDGLPASVQITANGNTATTSYTYCSGDRYPANGSLKWSKIATMTSPTGYTESYEYTSDTGWLSKITGTWAGLAKTTEYSYDNTIGGDTKNTKFLLERPRKIEEKIAGTQTALSNFAYSGGTTTEQKKLDASSILQYITTRNSYGPPSQTTPVGNYSYNSSLEGDSLTVNLTAPDRTGMQIINAFGTVTTSEVRKDGTLVSSDIVSATDSFGRPLKITHLNGSSEEFSNYCFHGPRTITRHVPGGAVDDVLTLEYNAAGMIISRNSTSNGKITSAYDPLGNLKSQTSNPSGSGESITESWTYDAQGRIKSHSGGGNPVSSTHSYNSASETISYSDGTAQEIARHSDGSTVSISGSAASPVSYEYGVDGTKGRWTKEKRGNGGAQWTCTFFNLLGQPRRSESSTGYWTETSFDSAGRPSASTDSSSRSSSTTYDNKNEVASKTVNGVTSTYVRAVITKNDKTVLQTTSTSPGSNGNIVTVDQNSIDGLDSWTTVNNKTNWNHTVPNGNGAYTGTFKNFENLETTRTSTISGSSTVLPGGTTLTTKLDGLGRITSSLDGRNIGVSNKYRNKAFQVEAQTASDGSRASLGFASGKNDPVEVTAPGEDTIGLDHDSHGNLEKVDGTASGVMEAKSTFNDQNQQTALETKGKPGIASTGWAYHANSGLPASKTIAGTTVASFTYHPDGRLDTFTKTIGEGTHAVKTLSYTPAPKLLPAGYSWDNATPAVTVSGHNALGQPGTISTGGICSHSFTYNNDTQITDANFTSSLTANRTCHYDYQNLRRSQMNSGGSIVNYTYENGRLKTVSSGEISAEYSYVGGSMLLIDGIIIKKNGSPVLERDFAWQANADRISSVANKNGSGQTLASFAYQYNPTGKISKTTRDDGTHWNYEYDPRGQLEKAERYLGVLMLPGNEFAYTSDSITNVLSGGKKKSDGKPQFTSEPAVFNSIETRVVGDKLEVTGSTIDDTETAKVTVSVNEVKAARNGKTFAVTLDAGNQLAAAKIDLTVVGAVFDAAETPTTGNNLDGIVGSDIIATASGSVLMPKASENPVYDKGGRKISDSLWTYSWDSDDRLVGVESCIGAEAQRHREELVYDYAGRRILKKVFSGSTLARTHHYFYDQVLLDGSLADFGVLTAETIINHETNETREIQYLWGLDVNGSYQGMGGVGGLLCVIEHSLSSPSSVSSYFSLMDAKGTIHGYIDETGTVVAKFAYDPYGRIVSESFSDNSSSNTQHSAFSFKFQSKYYDPETQLYYFGFRHYDPATCRWLNRDPLEESGGLNLYAYCNGDPVNGIDYLGCVWYNPLDSDFFLYNAGYNTGLHIYETGYSPVRAGKRMWNTGVSRDLINPLGRQFFAYEILNGGTDAVFAAGGIPVSILSLDAFDMQPQIEVNGNIVTFNGMANTNKDAGMFSKLVREKYNAKETEHVKNRTTFPNTGGWISLLTGDAVQVTGNEFLLIDITAIRGAQIIREVAMKYDVIYVYAHSQGTMTFARAMDLIDDPTIRSKIRYWGGGSEKFNSKMVLGINSSDNDWNFGSKKDLVPWSNYIPTPAKIFELPLLISSDFGYDPFEYGKWNRRDSSGNINDGNAHSFDPFYTPFLP